MKKRNAMISMAIAGILTAGIALSGCGGSDSGSASSASASAAPAAAESASGGEEKETAAAAPAATEETGNFALDFVSTKDSGYKVAYLTHQLGNVWQDQCAVDVEEVMKEYQDAGIISEYVVQFAGDDAQNQISMFEGLINQGYDAIVFSAVAENVLTTVVAKAVDAGILCVAADRLDSMPDIICVAGDNTSCAGIAMRWMCEQLGGKGDMLELTGATGATSDTIRQIEMERVLGDYPDINVLASAPGGWNATTAQEVTTTFLSAYADFDAYYTYESMQSGVIQAFQAAKRDLPKYICFDYAAGSLRQWANDYPDQEGIVTLSQPAVCADAVRVAVGILQGRKLNPEFLTENPLDASVGNNILLDPGSYVVTKEALDPSVQTWLNDYNISSTEFLSLDEAIKLMEGKEDSALLEKPWDQATADSYFLN